MDLIVKHPFVFEIIAVKVYIQVPLIRLLPFTLENCMEWVFSWAVIKWLSLPHPQLSPATAPEGRPLQRQPHGTKVTSTHGESLAEKVGCGLE